MTKSVAVSFLSLLLLATAYGSSLLQSKQLQTLQDGHSSIIFMRFLPDGERLISASSDATVSLWDLKTKQCRWQISLGKRGAEETLVAHITTLEVSSDGRTIAISYWRSRVVGDKLIKGDEERIALLDLETGQQKRDFAPDSKTGRALAFSPDSRLVASAGDKTVQLWNIETGKEIVSISLKERPMNVVFSPNQKFLAIATEPPGWVTPPEPKIRIHDAQTGDLIRNIPRHRRNVGALEFAPNSQLLAIVTDDARGAVIDLWDLTAEEPKRTLIDHQGGITAIAFSSDGRLLASGDLRHGGGNVIVRELGTNAAPRAHKLSTGVSSLSFSPNSSILAAGTDKGQIVLLTP